VLRSLRPTLGACRAGPRVRRSLARVARASPLQAPCGLTRWAPRAQTGAFSEDMIPTVGFNMRKVTKGNVSIKACHTSPCARCDAC
jgi:hypothetical protein